MARDGVNSKIIAQLGIHHGMNVYVLSQGRKIASYRHDRKGKRACLCFTVDNDHAWFYESEAVRRLISHPNIKENQTTQTIVHDFQTTRAEYRTWKPYTSSIQGPGYLAQMILTTQDFALWKTTLVQRSLTQTVKL